MYQNMHKYILIIQLIIPFQTFLQVLDKDHIFLIAVCFI